MDSDLDAHEGVAFLLKRSGDNTLGDGIGEAVGMSGRNIFGVVVHGGGSWIIWWTQGLKSSA